MAKFCGKCGSKLDEQTGKCPNCDKEINTPVPDATTAENYQQESAAPAKKEIKEAKKQAKKQEKIDKKNAKRAAMSLGQKVRSFFIKLLIAVLILAVLTAGIAGTLSYFDIVDIPVANSVLNFMGLKDDSKSPSENKDDEINNDSAEDDDNSESEPLKTDPIDADKYFEENSQVISETKVNDSADVHTEAETYTNLTDRGFTQSPITAEYSMQGEFGDAVEISDSSSTKHPMYETYYITQNGDIWTIFEINGVVMANPVSYNLQSGLGVQVMISETNTVTSYDNITNKFYENIPNESSLIVKTVSRIDAQTLETLTNGAIEGL